MLFAESAEHAELRAMVSSFLAEQLPERLSGSADALDRSWSQVVELGLVGLLVPEELDGQGGDLADASVVLQEQGACLAPIPLLATTTVLGALVATGSAAGRAAAAELCRRGASAALAFAEDARLDDLRHPRTVARAEEGGAALTGTKRYVIDAGTADVFLVSASWEGRPELFVVRRGAGVEVVAEPTLDQTRPLSTVVLDGAWAERVSGPDGRGVEDAVDLLYTALAAEAVGAAGRCLAMTVQHLRDRVQFGRPLGTFQALQHRCADLATSLDAATAALGNAVRTWGTPAHRVAAPLAFAVAQEAFTSAAAETIQMHGGIGFTWEHDAHRYFKRAASTELLFGSSRRLRRLVAERAGLFAPAV